jgi:DNA-binding MarR family transcriptional regulator
MTAVDESALGHLLGYHIARAEVPTRRVFFDAVGDVLQLRPVEFSVLMLLRMNADITSMQLSQTLAVSAPNMTTLLHRLEQRGLVLRERSERDRRAQHIRLTPEGSALADDAHARSLQSERNAFSSLSAAERAMLIELLKKVAASAP